MPVGTYTARENGQEKTKRRHREIGTLLEITYDGGGTAMVAKINVEALSLELQILMRANGILQNGDDAVLCNVYAPQSRQQPAAGQQQAGPPEDDEEDKEPF